MNIEVTDNPSGEAREVILNGLLAYHRCCAGTTDYRKLAVLLRDDSGNVTGGLWGSTFDGWLFIEMLFVPQGMRGRGVGAALLMRAEAEARGRGARRVWLDTFGFKARAFYERQGYMVFGQIANYPRGFSRIFLQKSLIGEAGQSTSRLRLPSSFPTC